jgi:DnaJ-class molecular chaperone
VKDVTGSDYNQPTMTRFASPKFSVGANNSKAFDDGYAATFGKRLKPSECEACDGYGEKDGAPCEACEGTGKKPEYRVKR